MAKAEREIWIELPEEDPMEAKGYVAALEKSMYGTQDTSNLRQKDYSALVRQEGYEAGKANAAIFLSKSQDARVLVHGDGFIVLADIDAM